MNEAQRGAVDECLQTFGGCGCMMQHWIGELHAKVRPGRTFSGTNEMVKELAGRFT